MIKLNKTIFDLVTVYLNLTQAETWLLSKTLNKVKADLDGLVLDITENRLFDTHYNEELVAVQTQLVFVNKNIKTLGDALLCHESKIFEKRLSLKDLQLFYLN